MRAEQITESMVYHGEGPVWWTATSQLRWVDMLAGDIMSLDPTIGEITRTPTGSSVAACIRPRSSGGAVVATQRAIAIADAEDLADLRVVHEVFNDPAIRFNDGGCDLAGNFYCGTMAYDQTHGAGTLYRVDAVTGDVAAVRKDVTISNGLAWLPEAGVGVYIDTTTKTLTELAPDFSDARVITRWDGADDWPDGLSLDSDGGIWVAVNGGSRVERYTLGGELTETVHVGARQVTACAFGGDDLRTLYITTSRENLEPHDDPAAGALFAVEPGVTGLPVATFAY